VITQGGDTELNYFPAKKVRIPVDTAEVFKNGVLPRSRAAEIVPAIEWDMNKNYIMKGDMMILDLLANNNWKRPVYFAITVGSENYLNLEDYFQLEGLAYRLVPIKTTLTDGQTGKVEPTLMYKNLMEKFKWGGMDKKGVYLDENNLRMTMNFRNNFGRLAETFLSEGKNQQAVKVLDKAMEVMPAENVPLNIFVLRYAQIYYRAGATEKGDKLVKTLADVYEDDLNYYFTLKGQWASPVERDMQQAIAVLQELGRITKEAGRTQLSTEMEKRFKTMLSKSGLS
jgi:tetratricopeptide (TPR) repeat protein